MIKKKCIAKLQFSFFQVSSVHPFSSKPLPLEKPIPCRHCPRSYKAINVRDLHERIHLSPYICDYCDQKFGLKSHIRNHLEIHRRMINPFQKVKKNTHAIRFKEDTARYSCEFCEKQFYSKLGYTSHLKQKHYDEVHDRTDEMEPEPVFVKEEPIRSDEDENDMSDDNDRNNVSAYDEPQVKHSKRENGHAGEYTCVCGEKFREFIGLVRHESNKHTEGFENMVKGLKDLLLYVINRVDNDVKLVSPKSEVTVKKEEEIEIEPYIDDFNQESDESSAEEKVITKKERKTIKRPREPSTKRSKTAKQDKFLCQYCDKQLAHKKSLEYHVAKKHQNIPIFRCKLCNRYFTDELEYQTHATAHEKDPELCCSACGFLCKGAAVLRRHVHVKHRTTEMEPRFFCQPCGKGFYYKCKLEEHSIIHKPQTERNPLFRCDICNMAFTRKSALNRHKLSHDDSTKTYTCTFCAKTFRRRQHLTAHLAMHTGARPREEICTDCGAIYSERRGLNNHMLRVHGRPLEGYKKQIKIVME